MRRAVVIALAAGGAVAAAWLLWLVLRPDASSDAERAAAPTAVAEGRDDSADPSTAESSRGDGYPWHTDVIAATFWVGEIFDPNAADGSQMLSTYDSQWFGSYGGCDGVWMWDVCTTEERSADDGYRPTSMTPLMNPFYLDLPYDDVHDPAGFAFRGVYVPWAGEPEYGDRVDDHGFSLMKTRWVEIRNGDRTCFGQIADAGPGEYFDHEYVFGGDDARPANRRYNGAGMDVSPALNACLDLEGIDDVVTPVDWRFVDDADVPDGPWRWIVDDDPTVR